jgi:hypothetical protein
MRAPFVFHRPGTPDKLPPAALPAPAMRRSFFTPVLGAALLAIAALGALPAEAGERQHAVTRSGLGGTVERSAEVTRSPRSREAHREREGAHGASRSVQRGHDAESGSAHREVIRSGPGGRSLERSGEFQREEDGYSRQRSVSGPEGATASRSVEVRHDPETGSYSREVARTGPQGGTVLREREFTP